MVIRDPNYRPSPQKPTIYSGPAVPAAYDPDWQYFTNLTPVQIAVFQSFPEWDQKVVDYNRAVLINSINIRK